MRITLFSNWLTTVIIEVLFNTIHDYININCSTTQIARFRLKKCDIKIYTFLSEKRLASSRDRTFEWLELLSGRNRGHLNLFAPRFAATDALTYVRPILSRYYRDFSSVRQTCACGGASVNVLRCVAHYRAGVTRHRNSTRRHWRANAQITSAIAANFGFTLITATLRGELQTRTRCRNLGGRCNLSHTEGVNRRCERHRGRGCFPARLHKTSTARLHSMRNSILLSEKEPEFVKGRVVNNNKENKIFFISISITFGEFGWMH